MQKLIAFLSSVLLLFACHSSHQTGTIQLNNGEKWAVNAEMKPHIEQGIQILNDYLAQKGSDHKMLAADLKAQNDQLIKSCTMKGKSHDELHKWLHPHMALVEKLAETSDQKQAESTITALEQSFKTYQNYFQ